MKAKQALIEELSEDMAQQMGLVLVAVEVLPGLIRVFADADGGITLGECEKLSRAIGRALDEHDISDEPYVLEVSSPGLERVLKTQRELQWATGKRVKLLLRDGKTLFGTLESADESSVSVDGQAFATEQIARISLSEVA